MPNIVTHDVLYNDYNQDLEEINDLETKEYWLTTIDNPFNPFENFDEWENFDRIKGYNTCNYLARITKELYNDMNEKDYNVYLNSAINECLEFDPFGKYIRVTKDFYKDQDRVKKLSETMTEQV